MGLETLLIIGGLILTGIFGFMGWLIKSKFTKLEEVDLRLTKVETKLDVLGDIYNTLSTLRTDVEIIKTKLEQRILP
jgi:hypothetical protein